MKIEIELKTDISPRGAVGVYFLTDGKDVMRPVSLRKLINKMIDDGDQKTADLQFFEGELRKLADKIERYRKGTEQ